MGTRSVKINEPFHVGNSLVAIDACDGSNASVIIVKQLSVQVGESFMVEDHCLIVTGCDDDVLQIKSEKRSASDDDSSVVWDIADILPVTERPSPALDRLAGGAISPVVFDEMPKADPDDRWDLIPYHRYTKGHFGLPRFDPDCPA